MLLLLTIVSVISITSCQEYTALPISIKKCPTRDGLEFDIDLIDKNGGKSLKLSSNAKKNMDDTCVYKIKVLIKSGPQYVHYLTADGNVCESVASVAKLAWTRFKAEMDPPIEHECSIEPGSYALNGFQIKKDEVNVPIPRKGKFLANTVITCNDKQLLCVDTEFEIIEEDD